MAYTHDIFISYKREPETLRWIVDHFEPLLKHAVGLELGRVPRIYRDNQLNDGGTWPLDLGKVLGSSRVLVSLWTKSYFHSEWCLRELFVMLERESDEGCRSPARPEGLIIPNILHDCETPRPELAHIQKRELQACFNSRMSKDSPRAEKLADELGAAVPGIARAIENAPQWKADWPLKTAQQFLKALQTPKPPQQTSVPGYGG